METSMQRLSREMPSQRYSDLVAQYREMHRGSDRTFAGFSLLKHLPTIKRMVAATGARSLLDYGSGKGVLYSTQGIELKTGETIDSVAAYLGVAEIVCYDPGVPEFAAFPQRKFDGVISTDVLEHIPESDIPWVIDEMFSSASKFVFANVGSFEALKKLPSGENAHVTQRRPDWWRSLIVERAGRFPGVGYRFEIEEDRTFLPKLFGKRRVTAISG
jgi:hypothetical protein